MCTNRAPYWYTVKENAIMECSSSESDRQKSDNFMEINSSSLLDGNQSVSSRALNSNINFGPERTIRSSRYNAACNDYGFTPVRRGREKTLWPNISSYSSQVGNDEAELVGRHVARDLEYRDVSLRQWLDNSQRSVDALACVYIYSQIVDIVNTAHSQGSVFHEVRPSCFAISPFNRISFLESVCYSDLDSSECDRPNFHTAEIKCHSAPPDSLSPCYSGNLQDSHLVKKTVYDNFQVNIETDYLKSNSVQNIPSMDAACNDQTGKKHSFHVKQILAMESSWYSSPEEVDGAPSSCASNIYQLGVLLFELFCTYGSLEEKIANMESLRDRVLPPHVLLRWPKEASFCLWLLHPEPSGRPMMSELLQSEFLNAPRDDKGQEAILDLGEKIEEQELLLEFLLLLQQRKHDAGDSLSESVSCVSSDIEEVTKLQRAIRVKGDSGINLDKNSYSPSDVMIAADDFGISTSRKRVRRDCHSSSGDSKLHVLENERLEASGGDQGSLLSKNPRLMKNFRKLEAAYFLTRRRGVKATRVSLARHSPVISNDEGPIVVTERNGVGNPTSKEQHNTHEKSGWINTFLEGLCKYLSFSKLNVKSDLKQGDLLSSSNLVCSISFDRDGEFFATAGVNKKIKVFEYCSALNGDRDIHYPVVEMASGSKLSSICWNGYIKSQIASSNFEGVVQVWDAARSQIFLEMKEHERRVWSIDFSTTDPTLLASGSDDGSVKLWNINQAASVGTIKTKANICCVQFSSNSSRSLAFGSADHRIYYYDIRNSKIPLCTLVGHNKTVSYVKFIDSTTLVSASTDNTLKLWDLSMCSSRVLDCPLQSFTGHLNVKNFVGLSVSEGFIATGSETNEVFVYHKAFPMPALSFKFDMDPLSGEEVEDTSQFISSVCWSGQSSTLVAANSMGNIKLLEMA